MNNNAITMSIQILFVNFFDSVKDFIHNFFDWSDISDFDAFGRIEYHMEHLIWFGSNTWIFRFYP